MSGTEHITEKGSGIGTCWYHALSLIKVALLFLSIMAVFVGLEMLTVTGISHFALPVSESMAIISAVMIANIACTLLIIGGMHWQDEHWKKRLALVPFSRRILLKGTVIAIGLIALYDASMQSMGRPEVPESLLALFSGAPHHLPIWLTFVFTAPLFEECLFRGILFEKLKQTICGTYGTIFITSIVWAAIHLQYDLVDMGAIFVAGIFLGWLREKSGSLYTTFLIHALWNAVACLQVELMLKGWW